MKKIIALILVVIIIALSITACGTKATYEIKDSGVGEIIDIND